VHTAFRFFAITILPRLAPARTQQTKRAMRYRHFNGRVIKARSTGHVAPVTPKKTPANIEKGTIANVGNCNDRD
jgi:hypothetical protein